MINRASVVTLAGGLLLHLLSGCHGITDYSGSGGYQVSIIRTSDMTIEGTIGGFEGGRALLSLGESEFMVLTNQGKLFRVHRPDLSVSDIYTVGQPDVSGYRSITRLPGGSVYFTGAFEEIIEFAPDVGVVLDEFSGGLAPVSICRAPSGDTLYIADAYDNSIREVMATGNVITRVVELPATPQAIAPHEGLEPGKYIVAVCYLSDNAYAIRTDWDLVMIELPVSRFAWDVAAMPQNSSWCIACPDYGGSMGGIILVEGPPDLWTTSYLRLGGHPVSVCAQELGTTFFVAGEREEGGDARVCAVDPSVPAVVSQVVIPGTVLDMVTHANEQYVLVLTSID